MQEEAELHSEEDSKKRELVDLQNQAEQLIYTTEKTLSEHTDKIDDSEKTTITAAVDKLKAVKDSDNPEEIKSAIEELTQVSQKLAEAMYKNVSPEAESGCQSGSCSEDACGDECKTEVKEDVVDAEYSVKS